jgi:DNA polymerase-3 subunit gamma/tau
VLLDNKQPIDTKPSAVQSIEAKTAIDSISTPLEEPEVLTNNMPILFDGNWRKLIELHLKLGIARALAQHCEMLSYDENSITLRVAEKQKHLVSATYKEKLSSAINMHFGRKIELRFQIDSEANTPAKEQAEEKAVIQSSAEEAIMNDAFVQALINDFDAKIIPNSIKPTT